MSVNEEYGFGAGWTVGIPRDWRQCVQWGLSGLFLPLNCCSTTIKCSTTVSILYLSSAKLGGFACSKSVEKAGNFRTRFCSCARYTLSRNNPHQCNEQMEYK